MAAQAPKKSPPKVSDLNIQNAAFYVSPIRICDFMLPNKSIRHTNTSTPTRFFAKCNVSRIDSIHTDDSAANLNEINESNAHKNDRSDSDSFVRPKYVGMRRPKPTSTKPLTIEQRPTQKTNNVDDTSPISIVSAMDMSSIAEWKENEENDKMCTTLSDDSFEIAKPKSANISDIVDSFGMIKDNQMKTDGKQNKTEESSLMNSSFELSKQNDPRGHDNSSLVDTTADRQPITVTVDVHPRDPTIETISVSSTSITTTLSTSSPTKTIANQPKIIIKPCVGFDASNSIHELSIDSQHNATSQKLVMKGGKWRRTVFESRKNKVTQCKLTFLYLTMCYKLNCRLIERICLLFPAPRRTLDRKSNQQPRPSHVRQSHANLLRRKSIFIKDVSVFVFFATRFD